MTNVECQTQAKLYENEIRNFLKQKIPDEMVRNFFEFFKLN